MGPQELERIAYTVECFLNALRVHDGSERTEIEEKLVNWFARDAGKERYAVYNLGSIYCYAKGNKVEQSFSLTGVKEGTTVWCDGRKVSLIDTAVYEKAGRVVLLGAAGLLMTMPGTGAAAAQTRTQKEVSFKPAPWM